MQKKKNFSLFFTCLFVPLTDVESTFARNYRRNTSFPLLISSLIRTFAAMKQTKTLLMLIPAAMICAAGMLLPTACRQGQNTAGQVIETFRQTGTYTVPAAADSHAADEEESVTLSAADLQKQRVGRGTSEIMLTRKGYVTSYNKTTRNPNWVAWTLTREHTYGSLLREYERFEEDPSVPQPRSTYQDYYNSRYDRGHMCPAGDNKWDQDAMTESFLMTNICPQNHGLNKEDWNTLEIQCRTWARRFGELTIVCGPLYEEENPRLIGRNRVMVPSAFFKVVYCAQPEPRAVGFIFQNNGSPQPWRQQVVSVDEVERRSGINFFHMLPDRLENRIEAVDDLEGW